MSKKFLMAGLVLVALVSEFGSRTASTHGSNIETELASVSSPYQEVLDILFPRDETLVEKEFTLVLRFMPSFDAESQLNVAKYRDGRIEAVLFTISNNKNVHYQLVDLRKQTGREDPEFLAKAIPVDKRVITRPARVWLRLRDRFGAVRFSPRFDTRLYIDPTRYDLWYKSVSNQAHFSLADTDTGKGRYDSPLVAWMNEALRTVK